MAVSREIFLHNQANGQLFSIMVLVLAVLINLVLACLVGTEGVEQTF